MNAAPYTHLIWKEYRAIRGFWIALIALAVFMQLLVLAFSQDRGWAIEFVYNIALATPVFFAIGCIGTAYAIEKEDGTFEWLRSSPASDAQLFISKVGLCLVATVAMFAILWFVTQTLFVAPPSQADVLRGMLGLWLLAGLEALAWGLLFSLLSARPLMAIVLALFATSTAVHVLSWIAQPYQPDRFEYSRYAAAIPLRLGLLAAVAAADVYLGLRWLGSEERTSLLSPREIDDASARRPATKADITSLLHRRDRAAILGRLTWQTFRQSGRMMFTLAALQVPMCFLAANAQLGPNSAMWAVFPLLAVTALMGANVFQSDQQRGNFRFFVEHNVPPRYVWLARLLPWIAITAFVNLISIAVWIGAQAIIQVMVLATQVQQGLSDPYQAQFQPMDWFDFSALRSLPVIIALGLATIPAFAAGQWISMFVRSGLLAGFFSLLLAMLLAIWAGAVYAMHLSWLLFLVPIPVVLLWATWLRAPDWILESATWKARLKAAGSVLVPGLILLTAAPFSRIAQVPDVTPGFDPGFFVAEITPAALETGELYRRASELYTGVAPSGTGQYYRNALERAKHRVADNQEPLKLILEASQRESCALANPAKLTNWPVIPDGRLLSLVKDSAYELQFQEKTETALDQALDRYFTALVVDRQLTSFAPKIDVFEIPYDSLETLRLLTQWGAHPDQTEARLREAIAQLEQVDVSVLNWDDALKSNYILCERLLAGDESVAPVLFPGKNSAKAVARIMFNMRMLPWERARERRALNLNTQNGLNLLSRVRMTMDAGGEVGGSAYRSLDYSRNFDGWLTGALSSRMHEWTESAITSEVSFETYRRATLLILALQAYRLSHDKLPQQLEQLVEDGFLNEIPHDPMSGHPFVYFPQGIPKPRTGYERYSLEELGRRHHSHQLGNSPLVPEVPGLWSPGLSLAATYARRDNQEPPAEAVYDVYYEHRWMRRFNSYGQRMPEYDAWLSGEWFPIPAGK